MTTLEDVVSANDAAEQIAGAAWTERRLDGVDISYVPSRDGAQHSLNPHGAHPGARLTWYVPGRHLLAFTADECDEILAASDRSVPSTHGTIELVERQWLNERISAVFAAAQAAWWPWSPVHELRHTGVHTYEAGRDLPWHCDANILDQSCTVAIVARLTDPADYAGGELQFRFDRHLVTAPAERGTVLVYPSTVCHRVTEVTRGRRSSLVSFGHRTIG